VFISGSAQGLTLMAAGFFADLQTSDFAPTPQPAPEDLETKRQTKSAAL
jgi:hypothetical protein